MSFEYMPQGPFSLSNQSHYFDGWPRLPNAGETFVIAFPVEGWHGSSAVTLRQSANGRILGDVYGPAAITQKAQSQALAYLSLDIDGDGWPKVGDRDPVIAMLQERYVGLRPILFHSPYEAAAGFILGHRISIKQKQALMNDPARERGDKLEINGQPFYAFPRPQTLLTLDSFKGLSPQKIERLHGIAQAALDGLLDRAALRLLPLEEALARLQTLPGVGPFFAEGILYRGAGVVDELTNDDLTQFAVQRAYHLSEPPDAERLQSIAQAWKPYRMWAEVLLHVWLRREVGLPPRRTFTPR
jgi:DNA-3-methyladenine glycosylase II